MDSGKNVEQSRIRRVAVVGAGTMGRGIAQVAAQAGFHVFLTDENKNILKDAIQSIESSTTRIAGKRHPKDSPAAEKFVQNTIKSIATVTTLEETVKAADLVIEAIVENLETKKALFAELDRLAPEKTILASNTSSLSIEDMAQVLKAERQFIGIHFFNPVAIMELVEVIRCSKTSHVTQTLIEEWLRALGKTTVLCKDTPGFIVNRLLIPMLMDAIKMLERGDATAESIDLALKLGAAHPMGPLRLADSVGLDVIKNIVDEMHRRCPREHSFEPSALLNDMVSKGKLGKKSGQGFYIYNKDQL